MDASTPCSGNVIGRVLTKGLRLLNEHVVKETFTRVCRLMVEGREKKYRTLPDSIAGQT